MWVIQTRSPPAVNRWFSGQVLRKAQHFRIGSQSVHNVERTHVSGMPDLVGLGSMGEDSVVEMAVAVGEYEDF